MMYTDNNSSESRHKLKPLGIVRGRAAYAASQITNANIMLGSTPIDIVTRQRPCTVYGVLLIDYITNGRTT